MDHGKPTVVKFLNQVVFPKLDEGCYNTFFDHKTALQEYLQKNGPCKIEYQEVWGKGPDNDRTYKMEVSFNGKKIGEGTGHTKKAADQAAAFEALKALQQN